MIKTQKELWASIINDARFYDGTPEMLNQISLHFEKFYSVTEIEQPKPIPDFIPVKIERCLHESGWKPYSVTAYPHRIKGGSMNFNTLKEVKEFFGIKTLSKIKNNNRGWAINSRGRKVEWDEYDAQISKEFIIG
jgi:hypothetical protein